jgi:RHS repeat-associated protein
VQNGSGGTLSNGATLTVNTTSSGFSVSATPTSRTVPRGGTATFTISVQSVNGFNGGVSLTALDLPGNQILPGTGFSPASVTPPANGSASSTLTIVTNNETLTGTFNITVQGQGGGLTRTTTLTLGVNGATQPSISSISPSSVIVNQQTLLTVEGSNFQEGFAASVTGPAGTFNIDPSGLLFVSNSQVRVQVKMGSTPPYSATLRLTNPSMQSATKDFQVVAAPSSNPQFTVLPNSGSLGTAFTHNGTNFTPNSSATIFIVQGNGSVIGPFKYNTDSAGNFSYRYTSKTGDPLGSYLYDVSDDSSGKLVKQSVQYVEGPPPAIDVLDRKTVGIDVTLGDGSIMAPGEQKPKIWKIRNGGTNAWTNYKLVFLPGTAFNPRNENLSNLPSIPINAAPGETFQTPPLPITAPQTEGLHYSYWGMENADGVKFGGPIWIIINVVKPKAPTAGLGGIAPRGPDSPPSRAAFNGDPVNMATGNFNHEQVDLKVPGRGMNFEFSRNYNSLDTRSGPLGIGWRHSFNIYLDNITESTATMNYSDGKSIEYEKDPASGTFRAQYPGFYEILVKNGDGSWSLQKPNQRTYRFSASGKLASIADPNQNQMSLSYDSSGNLSSVVDTVGRTFNFSYSGNLLTSLIDPAGRTVQFSYDTNSNLSSFRNARGDLNSYQYDGNRRLTRIVDGRANTFLTNTYDGEGKVVSQTNGRGNSYSFSYDFVKELTTVTDPNLKNTVYLHDTNFNLQITTDRLGQANVISYDERGNRKQASDAKGNYFTFSHDSNGNVQQVVDPLHNTQQINYDARNKPLSLIDALGKKTELGYDAQGNLTKSTNALGDASATTYDAFGQALVTTDANGNATTRTYDALGNLVTVADALNNITTFGYDAIGRRTSMTDARGKVTKYTYDANDNLLTLTDPLNNVTANTYDANNNLISRRDARGHTTTFTYDENNLMVKETDPKGNFVQHTYDKLDRKLSTRDKRGNVTSYTYDNEGRLLSVTDPLNNVMRYAYDANGNRTEVKDAKQNATTFTHDALNRITKIQDSIGNVIQKEYDAVGRVKRQVDPRGNATAFLYDSVGNLTQVTDAAGGMAKYSYDKSRNRISQTDPNNNTSSLTYDKLNRLLSSKDPLNHTNTYTYDSVGNRISRTDAKGQTTRYTFDDANRLTVVTYPDNRTVRLNHDANGNVTQMVDSLGTSSYVYDELNRLTTYTDPYGKTIGYEYDETGNITKLTYPDGKQVTYQFDANNRMSSLSDWAGKTTSFQYDSTNLLTRVTYPNEIVTSLTYDNAGRLLNRSDSGISSYSFTLDKNGNRISASITQPLGNRLKNTSQTYAYDAANRIQNAGAATFGFDANGNMTSKTEAGGVTTNYTYDFENRLVSVNGSSQYFYNGQGVRLQKTQGLKTTRYVVDTNRVLSQVLSETDQNDAITSHYVYGMSLAYRVTSDGTRHYYHFDPVGSTIAMTDDAKSVVSSYAYDAFGELTIGIEATANPFKFGGQYGLMDEANELLYVRARYYAPRLGRFLSKDVFTGEVTSTKTLNLYAYAYQNPLMYIDPSGNIVFSLGIGGDAGILLGVTGQVALVSDGQGQHGFAFSGGTSASLQAGAGLSGVVSLTSDSSITDLNGKSYSIGAGGVKSGIGYSVSLLQDGDRTVKGLSFSVGVGQIGFPVGTTTTWGTVVHLSDWQYNSVIWALGSLAAPLVAFDAAVKIGNSDLYTGLIRDAANQQAAPSQSHGPQVGPPNPVGRAYKP